MSHSLKFDADAGIVYLQFQGPVGVEAISQGFSQAILIAESIQSFRILSDYREATLKLSTLQIYSLPDTLSACKPGSPPWLHKYRQAILAKANDDFRFMETMLNNRAQIAALFETLADAENWLRTARSGSE
jgi:hypothetical protein